MSFLFIYIFIIASSAVIIADRGTYTGCYQKRTGDSHIHILTGNVDSCISACELLFFKYSILFEENCSCSNIIAATELEKTNCDRKCSKSLEQFCGGKDAESYYDTDIQVPGPVKNIKVSSTTESSILLIWDSSESLDRLDKYEVKAEVFSTFATYALLPKTWTLQNDTKNFELVNLHPGTKYNISITSMSKTNEIGGIAFILAETVIGVPDPSPSEPIIKSSDETTMTIEINPAVNNNGPINYYRVVVIFVTDGIHQTFDEDLLKDYKESQDGGLSYYIAAEIDIRNRTKLFTVGDGNMYRGYYNPPIPAGTHAHVSVGIVSYQNGVTKIKYAETSHHQHGQVIIEQYEEDKSALIIILSTACVIFGILLVASIFAYFYLRIRIRNRQRLPGDHHELTLQGPILEVENNGYVPDEYEKGRFKDNLNSMMNRLGANQKIPRNALTLDIDNIIGNGQFGDIIQGSLQKNPDSYSCQVHVISDDMEKQDQIVFLKDFDQLLNLTPHKNLLNFYGTCVTADWIYLIFEDITFTLKRKLIDARIPVSVDKTRISSISEEYLLKIMYDIAETMEYLSNNKLIHKQLCAFNVKITKQNELKLSIFGPTLIFEQGRSVELARWHSPEVLKFQHHTNKSDVWSFGCLMWECCSLGATLYANITAQDLLSRIKNGARPEQPSFVYDDLYQLLLNCWEIDPNERPSFSELKTALKHLMTEPRHALSFDRRDGVVIPYYLPLLEIKN